jgi:hypothetical protein
MNMKASNISLFLGFLYSAVCFAVFLSAIPFAHAEGPVIRSGESVGVEANQLLEGDFYGLGQTITLSGEASRDVYALGGTVTTNAPVNEDLVVIGGAVQVHGEVKDDVRIIGGDIVIAEAVADDVVVVGGNIHILSTAKISGDVIFFGGEIRIDGPVEGTVYGTANVVRINARVGEDVSVRAGESFTLGDTADVQGNITYGSGAELVRAQGAVVSGTITRDALFGKNDTQRFEPLIFNLLILLFSSLTFFFLAKQRTSVLLHTITEGYGRLGLIGLGMMVALPIVAFILMASVIGFLVGLALLCVYVVVCIVALMYLPIVIGTLVQKTARLGDHISMFTVILGVVVTALLPLVPVLGGLTIVFLGVIVIGALCNELYRFFKNE